jgi:hypothetical protein
VSLLWPETIHAGLFPGHCWLQRGRQETGPLQPLASVEPADLLHTLEAMLDEQSPLLRKGSRLVLTVSDSIAAIATLPWQAELQRPAEIESYAQVCFEKLGVTIGDNWVMQTEFRFYGGIGLAYALPREWMERLMEVIRARGHHLTAVLPISAVAYCNGHLGDRNGPTLLLLQEANRFSAMIYGKAGLLDYDVEPSTSSAEQARLRLLSRVASSYDNIVRIAYWSAETPDPESPELPANFVPAYLSKAELVRLKRDAWY